MKRSLIDTSILIAFLRGEQSVVSKVGGYLEEFDKLSLSIITYYEILRGLKYLGNERKLKEFDELMDESEIITLDRKIIRKGSEIYAELKREGKMIEDADILIAATCLVRGFVLITDNEKHFRRIKGLETENWLE
ncbi:PIN domain-containing protein [Geoglobus acetivorans]|uniref:Ribonuclease VapC n=1 Tax=Geoglobus acetivorans TaxID=565033 RepID=A0ABZ3H330_GEOAI|nr:type II toxin-antitoxin system VapC family toxin [Geoglobus acetivorans]